MENALRPETSEEVLWMVFSLLSLDAKSQVDILGGLPIREGASEQALIENGAVYLLSTIQYLYVSWLDEFKPCPVAQQLFDFVCSMDYKQSYEDFVDGDDWKRLRVLAKSTLQEVGLDPWPVPAHIDFNDYIEIVSAADLAEFASSHPVKN